MIDKYPSKIKSIEQEITSLQGWNEIDGKSKKPAIESVVECAASDLISNLGLDGVSAETPNADKDYAIQKIFTELTFASAYDEDILGQKQAENTLSLYELRLTDILRSLVDHKVVCSSDAASFMYLVNKVGVECYDLTIGRDDYSGAHQVNIYRLSDSSDWKVCDITQSRTFGTPLFDLPLERYMEVMQKDGVKPRVIFDCERVKTVNQPSLAQEKNLRITNAPEIATKGLFYNTDTIDKMVKAADEINSSIGSEKYKVAIHEEKKRSDGSTVSRVTLEGEWLDTGDAQDFWRLVRARE